jgi:hypothetical protein
MYADNRNMTRRVRRIILCSTILFFVLTAPVVLLYAWGYSFDWQKKKPVLTGGLYLKSIPKKAEVYIDDKPKKETPAFIKRLVPREYQVRVVKEGFYPWQKKLKVESKLVTEARNILLIPLNPKIEVVNQELTNDFSLEELLKQEKSNSIFYIQKPSYILYKTDQNNSFQEQISSTSLPNGQDYQIFASSNEQIAVLSDNQELYLFNYQTRSFELISQNVQGVQFSNDNKKLLYFTLYELWVYYLEGTPEQPSKNAGDKELITRLSQKIDQAIWYDSTSQHIIFLIDQIIKITELDSRDQRNTVDLIKLDIQEMAYSQKDEKIYFIKDKKLLSLSLE